MSLVSEIQDLIDDSGVFWIDQHVYDVANEALIEVWGELRHDIGTATITVTANQEFVDLPTTTIMIPQRIVANNVEWFVTNRVLLERDNRQWRALTQAQPKWFVPFDTETLQLVPRPDQTYTYAIEGVKYPTTEIAVGTEDITVAKDIKKALVFRAAALITMNTRPDLHGRWMEEFAVYINEARVRLRNRHGHNIRRLRPGKAVTRAHQGHRGIGRLIDTGN